MNRRASSAAALAAALTAYAAAADDLTGKDSFVCTGWHAVTCTTEGDCTPTEAWRLNMPDFLKVDLRARELVTPEGSDQPRASEIASIARNAGMIFLSGQQEARGFVWVINEASGEGTLAIASDASNVTVFTVCAATDALR
jgi:hypothetical protein